MEKLGIYEYVAVIVPGVVFLFGLGAILPETQLIQTVIVPHDVGTATVHLILAFALGHLLQVVGQLTHGMYWLDFGGLPTDWPFTRQHRELSAELQPLVLDVAGMPDIDDLLAWRQAVATVRTLITADGLGQRLETFQANYGMFRSLAVASILLLFVNPWVSPGGWTSGGVVVVILVTSLLGMHRFAVHYARELFAAVRAHQASRVTVWPGDDGRLSSSPGLRRAA